MDMTTHEIRRKHWLDIINNCNASGLSKKAWCEQNNISQKSFYYWQRQLRHEAYDAKAVSLPVEHNEVAFAEVTVPAAATAAKPVAVSATASGPDAIIRTRTMTIEISNNASQELLSFIRSVMINAS